MKLTSSLNLAREYVLPTLLSWLPRKEPTPFDLFGNTGLRMTCYRDWPGEAVVQAWTDLAMRCASATAFQTPDWQLPLLRQALRLGRMRLLTVFQGTVALAMLPLQVRGNNRLETAGSMISDYLEPLVDPAHEELAWSALLTLLRQLPDFTDGSLVLHNIRCDATCRAVLKAVCAEEGFALEDATTGSVARVPLPESWDAYLGSLSAHDRKECRRKLRKAETQAQASLTVCQSPDAAPQDLEHIFQWMESGGGTKGTKCRWIYRRVFDAATRGLMQKGIMRLETLQLQGKPAAGIISFRSAGGPLAWGAGYDADQSAWSPGVVLFAMAIREAITRGERAFDFLRGDQRYKYDLGAVDHPLHRLTLTRSHPA